MRAKLVNEAIKHLTPKSEEEVKNSLASSKVAFYHIDTDEFEYNGKRRTYTSSSNVVSFLRTKDYLVSVKKGKPLGFARADLVSSWINSGYGSIYTKANVYDWENKTFLKYLCTGKYPVNEAIKHLTPREFDTNSNLMRALEEFDEARKSNSHSLLKENRDNIIIIMETLTELGFLAFFKYTWVMSAFSIHLDDIEHQYTKEFSGFYIPIDAYKKDYPDPYVAMAYKTGLELTERISTGSVYARNNGAYLHPTLDMDEVKKFVLQFKK